MHGDEQCLQLEVVIEIIENQNYVCKTEIDKTQVVLFFLDRSNVSGICGFDNSDQIDCGRMMVDVYL